MGHKPNHIDLAMSVRTFVPTLITAILTTSLLSGCGWLTGCEEGTGPVVEKNIVVGAFTGIAIDGSLDAILHTEGTAGLRIEGQANVIELITTEVKDGLLLVGSKKCYSTSEKLVVHITQPSMALLRVMGSGSITCDGTLHATDLSLEVEGSGNIKMDLATVGLKALVEGSGDILVTGECSTLKAVVSGSGNVDAYGLRTGDAQAEVTGSGDIRVNVLNNLNAEVTGSGDINFKGDPIVTKKVTGSGAVSKQ